ncbi:thioesterase domain-containing protein, partial [Alcaligenes faecalis]
LDALPLNANGKIDRRSLPAPEFISGQEYEAPQGEREVALASIWSQVLGVERVGRHDNFFELGGHSLMALTLVGEISKQNLGIPGDLAMLLRTQTVAAYIAEHGVGHRTIALNQSLEKSPPLFMIHDGRGSILDYFHLGQALAPSCPVVGLPIDSDRVPDSLQTLARMHAQTIQAYQPSGSLKMAGWSLGGALALQVAAILEAQGRDVAWVGAIDPYTQALDDLGFDFSQFVHQYVLAIVDPEQHETLLSDPFVSACLKNLTPFQADLTQMTVYIRAQYPVNHQSGLAQLNDQELAELCMTSWLLYQARKVHCPAVQVQASVHTWWAGDGTNAEYFSQWMGSPQRTEVVLPQDDHGSIVRSPRLLADLQALCRAA